jgi:Peptidase M60, enhancin and enhancin-like/N-terminal domain of M60-like peptidases
MLAPLLALCFLGAPSGDRAPLLEGVSEIVAPGSPGALAVYGSNAQVIVAGKADGDVQAPLVAAATLGKGRIVAFGHDGYFNKSALEDLDTNRLVQNSARWAAREKSGFKIGLVQLSELGTSFKKAGFATSETNLDGDLTRFDVLALKPTKLRPSQLVRLRRFVENGGGLLAAVTGWGWQQGSDLPMQELAGNQLLAGSGLAWTNGFANKTTRSGYRADAEVSPLLNADTALERIAGGAKLARRDVSQATASILLALRTLPPDEAEFHGRLRQILRAGHVADAVPTARNPVRADDPLRRLAVAVATETARAAPVTKLRALPAANDFPGAVPRDARRASRTITIDTAIPDWHSLGVYAAPGETITVTVPSSAVPLGLSLRIGAHTDELWALDRWERSPELSRTFALHEAKTVAASAFGGLVYLVVPGKLKPRKIEVTIAGAVDAPFFQLGVTSLDDWRKTLRQRPAPWAELAGKTLIWTVPSKLIRSLDNPESLLTLWDSVVLAQDAAVALPKRHRPERIVLDRQISAGYMHSGYPIMAPIDDSAALALDEPRLRAEGSWGHFHELGHNHQDPAWTFEGTGEVTNNVLVLYVFDTVLKLPYDTGHEAIRNRAARLKKIHAFQDKGAPFAEWKIDPFLALMMYMQLYEGFGWTPLLKVLAEYRALPSSSHPRSDASKRDQWLTRYSRAVGKNLGPFLQSWGVPTSDTAREALKDLPAWMPEGFTARP